MGGSGLGAPQQTDKDQSEVLPAPTDADDFSAEVRADLRTTALGEFMKRETTPVTTTDDTFGRPAAEWVYGADLVQRALRLANGQQQLADGEGTPVGGHRFDLAQTAPHQAREAARRRASERRGEHQRMWCHRWARGSAGAVPAGS
ncbi:hypothetical protein [Streptomyces celluloflavus]|uniref:hypothetical protein n=1 Tax=Streptomyces celluloflavus TaxID=58344 RepID=UPI00367A097D